MVGMGEKWRDSCENMKAANGKGWLADGRKHLSTETYFNVDPGILNYYEERYTILLELESQGHLEPTHLEIFPLHSLTFLRAGLCAW